VEISVPSRGAEVREVFRVYGGQIGKETTMKIEVEAMEKAKAFYGVAKNGKIVLQECGIPFLWRKERNVILHPGERVVLVYLLVEDD
jgi:hypothetical protein